MGYTTLYPIADTWLDQVNPNTNNNVNGGLLKFSQVNAAAKRIVLRFNLLMGGWPYPVNLTDATLLSTALWLWESADNGKNIGTIMWAYKCIQNWVEAEATWNSYAAGSPWIAPGGDYVIVNPVGAFVTKGAVNFLTFNFGLIPGDPPLQILQDAIAHEAGIANFLIRFALENVGVGTAAQMEYWDRGWSSTPELYITFSGEPLVTTQAVTDILAYTATGNGNITDIGNAPVTQRGHCWSLFADPTIADDKTTLGAGGVGAFVSPITGLTPDTPYHIRAYATNSIQTSYGVDVVFTTLRLPTVQTLPATGVT